MNDDHEWKRIGQCPTNDEYYAKLYDVLMDMLTKCEELSEETGPEMEYQTTLMLRTGSHTARRVDIIISTEEREPPNLTVVN